MFMFPRRIQPPHACLRVTNHQRIMQRHPPSSKWRTTKPPPPTHPPHSLVPEQPPPSPTHSNPAAIIPPKFEPESASVPPLSGCSPAFGSGETPQPGAGIRSSSEPPKTRWVILADGGKVRGATNWSPLFAKAHRSKMRQLGKKQIPRQEVRRSFVSEICKSQYVPAIVILN